MLAFVALFVSCSTSNADKKSTADDSTAVAMNDTIQADDTVVVSSLSHGLMANLLTLVWEWITSPILLH